MDAGLVGSMNAVSRFVREGLSDAERRVARLTSPLPVDDARVVAQLESSVAFSAADRAVNQAVRAYETSILVAAALGAINHWWISRSWQSRRFAVGVVLMVAAATYLGLYLIQQSPIGWLWLLLPGMALVIGALSIAGSGALARRTDA